MITKEQKELIKMVKKESGTNEFLSVSDLIVRIEQNYKEKGEDIYYEDVGITFSEWNDFLRNTPLSMDLFIGEGAIFEGFVSREEFKEHKDFEYTRLEEDQIIKPLDDFTIKVKQKTNSSLKKINGLEVRLVKSEYIRTSGSLDFVYFLEDIAAKKIPLTLK